MAAGRSPDFVPAGRPSFSAEANGKRWGGGRDGTYSSASVREFHPLPFSFRPVVRQAKNRPLVDFLKSKQL